MEDLVMRPEFWRGRKVFITGHTGFKGSWLSLWLQQLGAELTGYALKPPTSPSLFEKAQIAKGMQSIEADILDLKALCLAMQAAAPEIVFHLAAQPLVRYSYQDPVTTYATNVMGTVHLLEAVRSTSSVRAVVNVTTDKCYDNREWIWGYRENDPLGGHDPYSSSKGCAELVSAAYRTSFFNSSDYIQHGVALATVRAGNVIGGGDWSPRLIPDCIAAFEKGQPVHIRYPQAIRPWQHVLEPLHGYLMLAEKLVEGRGAYAEAWNFGPQDEDAKPVAWIVAELAKRWGNGASWVPDSTAQSHEAQHLKLDSSKARWMLEWTPLLHLEEALAFVVSWAQAYALGQQDPYVLTLAQIQQYQERCRS